MKYLLLTIWVALGAFGLEIQQDVHETIPGLSLDANEFAEGHIDLISPFPPNGCPRGYTFSYEFCACVPLYQCEIVC